MRPKLRSDAKRRCTNESTSPRKSFKKPEKVCAFPLSYNRHCLFLMHARPYTRRRRSTVHWKRSPVCEIGATCSPVRKTRCPQLTRTKARRRRAKLTKKRKVRRQRRRRQQEHWWQRRQRKYCSRSHPNALLMDFDTETLLSQRTARRYDVSLIFGPRVFTVEPISSVRRRGDIKMETTHEARSEAAGDSFGYLCGLWMCFQRGSMGRFRIASAWHAEWITCTSRRGSHAQDLPRFERRHQVAIYPGEP